MNIDEIEKNKLRHELILQAEKLIEITNKYPNEFYKLRNNLISALEHFIDAIRK